MKLQYGLLIQAPLSTYTFNAFGTKNEEIHNILCSVEKYWEDDIDANKYKVKLVPVDIDQQRHYYSESFYSRDLIGLIKQNKDYKIVPLQNIVI